MPVCGFDSLSRLALLERLVKVNGKPKLDMTSRTDDDVGSVPPRPQTHRRIVCGGSVVSCIRAP